MTVQQPLRKIPIECKDCMIVTKCMLLDSGFDSLILSCPCRICLFKTDCREPCGERKDLLYFNISEILRKKRNRS